MNVILDGERSRRWVPFAKNKLQAIKDIGISAKSIVINGYSIRLLALDDIDKIHITAPPYTSVGAGHNHVMMADPTGARWVWGNNGYGQLGVGDTVARDLITRVEGESQWAMFASGRSAQSAGIKRDGTLWVWGKNYPYSSTELEGALGLGPGTGSYVGWPTELLPGTKWAYVTTSSSDTSMYAIKIDGTLWCWGLDLGYLGFGPVTATIVRAPTQVGTDSDWRTVSAHTNGAMAIKRDGTLWAVGQNRFGALGLGDDVPRYSFTQVGTDRWRKVFVGFDSAVGIKEDGTLWATGDTYYPGPVGYAFTQISEATNWVDITGDEITLLALNSDGVLYSAGYLCWPILGRGAQPLCTPDYFGPEGRSPLAEVGNYGTNCGIFSTQFTALAVGPAGKQWVWGLIPGEPIATNGFYTPYEIVGARLMLPAAEPLSPPWV